MIGLVIAGGPKAESSVAFKEPSYSGKIFASISMHLHRVILRRFDARAIAVIAALLSLGVSNNVGPCFLPLPLVTDCIAQNPQQLQSESASRSSSGTDSFRVPMMMGQTQKRTDKEHRAQPIAGVTTARLVFSDDARVATELHAAILPLSARSVSQPPGRAPPRLV